MGGPDLTRGRIERDSFGVGNVVAELRGFSPVNRTRRNVEAPDGEFRAAQLFNCEAVVLTALLGLALLYFLLVLSVGFVPRKEDVRDVEKDAKNQERRIEKGILEGGFG